MVPPINRFLKWPLKICGSSLLKSDTKCAWLRMGNGILEADEEETRPSHHCGPHDHLLKSRYLERDSRPGLTWNDLKSPGTWPPHVINTYKIHDGYVQPNIKIQKKVAYTMWLFPFPDVQIFSFCRPKYPEKTFCFKRCAQRLEGKPLRFVC